MPVSTRALAFALALPCSGAALAQSATAPKAGDTHHPLRDRFEAANTGQDGHLTLAQAQAGHMPQVARNFETIDSHHNGYVTIADIQAFRQAKRAAAAKTSTPE